MNTNTERDTTMSTNRHSAKLQIIREMNLLLEQLEQDILTEEWMQELCIDDLEANLVELARLVRRRAAAIDRITW
jgi:hypothetical protein